MRWLLRTLLLVTFCLAPAFAEAAEKALCPVCVTLEGARTPEAVHAWRTYDGTRYGL